MNVITHRGVLDRGLSFIQNPFSRRELAVKAREVLDGMGNMQKGRCMEKMRLRRLHTMQYKNLRLEQGLELADLNVLIGPNGAGKSNFINVLEFLKNSIKPTSDLSNDAGPFGNAVALLGGSRLLDHSVSYPGHVELAYDFSPADSIPNGVELTFKLYMAAKDAEVSIADEALFSRSPLKKDPFYHYQLHNRAAGAGVVSIFDDDSESSSHFEPVKNVPTHSLGLTVIQDLMEKSQSPPQRTPVYKVRKRILEYVNRWHFYKANYMSLDTIKAAEPKIGSRDIYLAPSGANLAIVIENLIQRDINFEDELNLAMRSILPRTRRLRPVRTGLMTVSLEWHLEDGNDCLYLNEMSDGTIRMLCWASVLLSPEPPSLIVIDEPELGIHPAWLPILAEWIKRASKRTQLIVTTHSPDLLDGFTDCLDSVFRCLPEANGTHFSIERLSQDKVEEMLDEGWKLGDLYRVGDPGIGGWPW